MTFQWPSKEGVGGGGGVWLFSGTWYYQVSPPSMSEHCGSEEINLCSSFKSWFFSTYHSPHYYPFPFLLIKGMLNFTFCKNSWMFMWLWHYSNAFCLANNFGFEILVTFRVKWKSFFCNLFGSLINLCDGSRSYYNKVEMEILCKWNGNFRFDLLEQKKWSTPVWRLFWENFHLIHVFHLQYNRLNQTANL